MTMKTVRNVVLAVLVTGVGISGALAAGKQSPLPPLSAGLAEATFASGCFWCGEKDFESVPGVTEVISGYTGGSTPNPTYEQVGSNTTGHYEAIRVRFDPKKVSYDALLDQSRSRTIFLPNDRLHETIVDCRSTGRDSIIRA